MCCISVNEYNSAFDFDINGVSYIGRPVSGTAMYVSRKIKDTIINLESVERCLVFVEDGLEVNGDIYKNNAIVFCDNPQLSYARFAIEFESLQKQYESTLKYSLVEGSYISESAKIGERAYIEPGCMIGHGVKIGNDAVILTGSVIKHATIGHRYYSNEFSVIGANAFTITCDEDGNNLRIPSLGKVIIGDEVEIGAHDTISRGSVGTTIIGDNAKLDSFVQVGHDNTIGRNVEIASGVILGGFDVINEGVFIGMNATIRNRITVGEHSTIGMGAVVLSNVGAKSVVVGNPAGPIAYTKEGE